MHTQQSSLLPAPESALGWRRLTVPAEQRARLHAGGAQYLPDFITASEETELLAEVEAAAW